VAEVTSRVLPGTVFTPSHFCPDTPLEANRSEPVNCIVPNSWDRISAQHNGVGCRLVKA
jgi:formate dehydrogenase major subunit